ncbi:hypothetical protein AHiyo8_65320 [Arthrobacter sp. Hiyo8]|nr:hypothetical protein AHiyo8_65320 [Arthrobacter sp. Hiyo8]
MEVVAVVPAHHEAKVLHRSVRGGAGADSHLCRAAEEPEVAPVPRRLAVVGRQPRDVSWWQDSAQCRLHAVEITIVGNDDDGAPP